MTRGFPGLKLKHHCLLAVDLLLILQLPGLLAECLRGVVRSDACAD